MEIKNGLVAIATEVLADVEKEAEAIIRSAAEEAKKVLQTAKVQADQHYTSQVTKAKVKAESESRRIASLTEIETRNNILKQKEKLIDEAFKKAHTQLLQFTNTEQYHHYLLLRIEEAAKKFGARNVIVQVNGKDAAWLTQNILDNLSKKLQISLELAEQADEFVGGFRIQSQDGRVTYDNTFDNRLKELELTMRTQIAKKLFEEKL